MGAGYGNRSVGVTAPVRISDATVEQDLERPSPDAERFLVAHVFGPDGRRLSDVRFETAYAGGSFSATGGNRFFRRDDGAFLVRHHSWDTLRYGTDRAHARSYVEAISEKLGSIGKEYVAGETRELTLRFRGGARVNVQTTGYVDSGHEGRILVFARKAGARDPHFGSRHAPHPDAEGKQFLGVFQPGAYELIVVLRRSPINAWPLARHSCELRPDENAVTIPLPELHTLTIMAAPGLRASLSQAGDRHGLHSPRRAVDKEGKALFEHLPAGTYHVGVRGNGVSHSATVKVPEQAVVRLP